MGIGTATLPNPWGAQKRRGATAGLDKILHQQRQQPGFIGTGNTWAIQGPFEDAAAAVVFYSVKDDFHFVSIAIWELGKDIVKESLL